MFGPFKLNTFCIITAPTVCDYAFRADSVAVFWGRQWISSGLGHEWRIICGMSCAALVAQSIKKYRVLSEVKISLVIIGLLLALVGWLRPDDVPLWLTIGVTALLIVGALVQGVLILKNRKENKKDRYSGTLRRVAGEILISADDKIYPKLEFGDSGAILVFAGPPGQPLFKFFEDCHLTVSRDGSRIMVSTSIFDGKGNLVADLVNNEWQVNRNVSYDRNFTDNALEVKDSSGDIVLQVRLVEDRVQLQGKFYGPNGDAIAFGKGVDASGSLGGIMEMTGPNNPVLKMKIQPMFLYPSELHLGELNTP